MRLAPVVGVINMFWRKYQFHQNFKKEKFMAFTKLQNNSVYVPAKHTFKLLIAFKMT